VRILLTADDFGFSADTVRATIECCERGALTNASLMARMPATAEALAYARTRPDLSFGVHLTLLSDGPERPVCAPAEIPALVDADGRFLGSNTVRLRLLLRRLPVAQIEREVAAQLALVRDSGVSIAYVDTHGHTHKFAPFREALLRVLPRFGVRRVRSVQDLYLRRPLRSPTYWLGRLWRRALRARFVTTDHFYMPASAGDREWVDALLGRIGGRPDATLEIGVHPGHDEPWRDAERRAVQEFALRIRAAGHELIGWRDL
jgi:hypothetical protein